MEPITYSLIVPVYNNEGFIADLLGAVDRLHQRLGSLEAVFVVDGSPDASGALLSAKLRSASFPAQLITHSRNFGSFAAIRTGLEHARGAYCAILSADLQEPLEFIETLFRTLQEQPVDVIIGVRRRRSDPFFQRWFSALFWSFYKKWIQPEMPSGGVDVFGCNRVFCETLAALKESNTTLVGLVVWMGFRRTTLPYDRLPRRHGTSGWTFRRKIRYMQDSLFAFSDLPVYGMIFLGLMGVGVSVFLAAAVLVAKKMHGIQVPGYTATILAIMFFGGLNSFGLGILGSYIWRAFENTKGRPSSLVMSKAIFPAPHEG